MFSETLPHSNPDRVAQHSMISCRSQGITEVGKLPNRDTVRILPDPCAHSALLERFDGDIDVTKLVVGFSLEGDDTHKSRRVNKNDKNPVVLHYLRNNRTQTPSSSFGF